MLVNTFPVSFLTPKVNEVSKEEKSLNLFIKDTPTYILVKKII